MQSFKGAQAGPTVCYSVTVNIDPPNLAANTGVYLDVAIPANPGCQPLQRVMCCPSADISTVGYTFGDIRVKEATTNTVRLQCVNVTAGALNPAALDVNFVFFGKVNA